MMYKIIVTFPCQQVELLGKREIIYKKNIIYNTNSNNNGIVITAVLNH